MVRLATTALFVSFNDIKASFVFAATSENQLLSPIDVIQ